MPICDAIDKYGINSFSLYILEIVPLNENLKLGLDLVQTLGLKENNWYYLLFPSYNVDLNFLGQSKNKYGRNVSLEARQKMSEKLKGRVV